MQVAGQFFLCMSAVTCMTSDGQPGVLFALREPAPAANFPNGLQAVWVGEEALELLRQHAGDLRPGRGLQLTLTRFTAREDQIRSRVLACELLPIAPSWQRALANQQQPTQAQPPA